MHIYLGNAVSNGLLIASATDDGGVLLANLDLAGAAQQLDGSCLLYTSK